MFWNHFLLIVLVLCVKYSLHSTIASIGGTYGTKFDNIDIDSILGQNRLLTNYIKCLENVGPCASDAKILRDILLDAISTNCSKCSEKQKYDSGRVINFLIDNRLSDWKRLEKIYDPKGIYRNTYVSEKN